MIERFTTPPARVMHNGKLLRLRPPTPAEINEAIELRRAAAERRRAERDARESITTVRAYAP
jgi:hypothetical protein